MYASKRRQRNFKRVRSGPSHLAPIGKSVHGHPFVSHPQQLQPLPLPSNPSKRHRERLNGELDTVASLLPYEEMVLQKLDKLSVLRLAVSFLQIKAHFQVCAQAAAALGGSGRCADHPWGAQLRVPMGPVPTLVDPHSGVPTLDYGEPNFGKLAQKALGAFLLVLHLDGDIFYVSENIDTFLGYQQSDVLHQPLFEMIHSEDREEFRMLLQRAAEFIAGSGAGATYSGAPLLSQWIVPIVLRFRCLLDNTCGFIRVELRTHLLALHSHRVDLSPFVPPSGGAERCPSSSASLASSSRKHALVATCTPFVPPLQMDPLLDDPILKSKHSLDLAIQCLDSRLRRILELDDECSSDSIDKHSLYSFVHPGDLKALAEAHDSAIERCSSGLMVYRLISARSQLVYFFQSSFRLFYKNNKPDSIGGNHRILTEIDGESLLEKRNTLKFKYLSFDDTLLQSPRIFSQPNQQPAGVPQPRHSPLGPSTGQRNPPVCATELSTKCKKSKKGVAKGGREGEGKRGPGKQTDQHKVSGEASGGAGPMPLELAQSLPSSSLIGTHLNQTNLAASSASGSLFPASLHLPVDMSSSALADPCSSSPSSSAWPQNSAKLSATPAAPRLKRTQVTFERYYAETVDLSPYCGAVPYYYCPSSASVSSAGFHPLMDFAYPLHSPTADYWSSMMLAAAGGTGAVPEAAYGGAGTQQHFPAPLCFNPLPDPSASSSSASLHQQLSPAWLNAPAGAPFSFSSGGTGPFCWPSPATMAAATMDLVGPSVVAAALYPAPPSQIVPVEESTTTSTTNSSASAHCFAGGSVQWTNAADVEAAVVLQQQRKTPPEAARGRAATARAPPPPPSAGMALHTSGSATSSASGFRFLSEMAQTLFG